MKLGIISPSKVLTVFIKENKSCGLYSENEGIRVTHGKLWGKVICLFELSEKNERFRDKKVAGLLSEYRVGQLLSFDIGRTNEPWLQEGDIVLSSDAQLWQVDSKGLLVNAKSLAAHPKLMDKVLSALERYKTEEVDTKAVVGSISTYQPGAVAPKGFIPPPNTKTINCWDMDGYYLAEFCEQAKIPWVLVRLVLDSDHEIEELPPNLKWDMAKKCFWIVKGVVDSTNLAKGAKKARKLT